MKRNKKKDPAPLGVRLRFGTPDGWEQVITMTPGTRVDMELPLVISMDGQQATLIRHLRVTQV